MSTLISVAGDDPGTGVRAGLQADAEMARGTGTHFLGVVAVETTQGAAGLSDVRPRPAVEVEAALRRALMDAEIRGSLAVKTGALGNAALVDAVIRVRADWPQVPWVVDPVSRASRVVGGAPDLLDDDGWDRLCQGLVPISTLVVPNQSEFERGHEFPEAPAVLLTGGDGDGEQVIDALRLAGSWREWRSPRIPGAEEVHGTGCRLSAAVACALAAGLNLEEAIEGGRRAFRAWLDSVAG